MTPDRRFAKWVRWLKDDANRRDIYHDVLHLRHRQQMWKQFVDIVRANPDIPQPGPLVNWLASLYADSIVMGIRRQADYGEKSVSLVVLLKDMIQHPEVMTRERYFQLSLSTGMSIDDPAEVAMINGAFDKYAEEGDDHVDPAIIEQDMQRVQTVSASVRSYVNRRIAHRSRTDVRVPTFAQLDAAMDELDVVLRRYYLLLIGKTLWSAIPIMQDHPWIALTVPWIPTPE